jgi:hypothetical protein
MDTKKLKQIVGSLHEQFPNASSWDLYYKIRRKDDSVTQRRVHALLEKIETKSIQSKSAPIPEEPIEIKEEDECNCTCWACRENFRHCHKKNQGCNL